MSCKVFIEKHLESYVKNLAKHHEQSYTPGVIIGQVIGNNYYVVHLAALTVGTTDVLSYQSSRDVIADSKMFFERLLPIVNLIPGGSHVLGIFFIVPQDIKSFQPINIDFNELNRQIYERLPYDGNTMCNKMYRTWDYLLINYSTINKKLFCYTVDFKHSKVNEKGPKVSNFKSVDYVFESLDNDWVTLVGTFNFESLGWFDMAGGPKALLSIRDDLLNKLESILNGSVVTFNGRVCDEKKILKDFECNTIGDVLNNVINIEIHREVDIGNECKNASLMVESGKGKVTLTGLCSIAVPFNRNGSVKDAIKAIYEDTVYTFATRLNMHLQSLIDDESTEEDIEDNIVHETPRRILILKTEGSKFAFSDYVFPGGNPREALIVAGEILNLPEEKIELYNELEKGRYSFYEELTDINSSPQLDAITVTCSNNNGYIYYIAVPLILAILAYVIKHIFL